MNVKLTPEEIDIIVDERIRRIKYEAYLQYSPKWKRIRKLKLLNADYACEKCGYRMFDEIGEYNIDKRKLDVHHKTYERLFNELPDDLMVLCRKCHAEHHQIMQPEYFRIGDPYK